MFAAIRRTTDGRGFEGVLTRSGIITPTTIEHCPALCPRVIKRCGHTHRKRERAQSCAGRMFRRRYGL